MTSKLASVEEVAAQLSYMRDSTHYTHPSCREVIDSAIALLSALEKDALRYRWLKTRINWKEVQGWSTTNRTAPPLTWTQREWTHVDLRPNRPEVEHIDEYLDTAIDLARGQS